MSASMCALLGFAALTIGLVFAVVLYRTMLVFTGKTVANSWTRGGQTWQDPPVITRMTHAHMNCVENLPLVATVILAAQVMGKGEVTDGLACVLLGARLAQAAVHVIAVNHWMVFARASFWSVQALILVYWLLKLAGLV